MTPRTVGVVLAGCLIGTLGLPPVQQSEVVGADRAGPDAARRVDPILAGLRVADRLVAGQDESGAIRDSPGSGLVNEDSSMAYALWGPAAAYTVSGRPRYLTSLRRGVGFLAGRMVMRPARWRGSYWYAYAARPPYRHVPVPPGPGLADARGVDATSALFVYDLWLYTRLSGDRRLAVALRPQARAAVRFLLERSRLRNGFFASSWHRRSGEQRWRRYRFQYAADQADVALGLAAASRLYGDRPAGRVAAWLSRRVPAAFFLARTGRFALGRDGGGLDASFEGFNGIFPQGYLPWVFGPSSPARSATRWLAGRQLADGSYVCHRGDPRYSLTPDVAVLGATAGHGAVRTPSAGLAWLLATTYHPATGEVGDSLAHPWAVYSNVAGFTALALIRPPSTPFTWPSPARGSDRDPVDGG